MLRRISCLGLFGAVLLAPLPGSAQSAVLLAVADATQLSELRVAKVMADDSSLWLSVRLQGRTRLALVTERTSIESAPAADAWLRALDFATRVRVAAPPGPLAGCASRMPFALADSGLPEPGRVAALEVSSASSELELRRVLQDAELPVDVSRVAQFASDAQPPFQVAIYDAPVLGGSTETLRLIDHGHPLELPRVQLSGAKTLAISLIALAKEGVLPLERESADASEFPVAYRALDASSDYLSARSGWLAQNPTRWLNEVQASAALFAGAVLPLGEPISPAISRYFAQLSGASTGGCEAQIQAARARASLNTADFACGGADDLSHSLSEVDFADLRLSRFWGMASAEGMKFRVAPSVPRSPILLATDFDASGCPTQVSQPVNGASGAPDSRTPPPVSTPVVRAPDDPYYYPTPVTATEGSSTVTVINSGSNDSCGGDSRSSKSSNDSCSGDSSSSDSGDDSCSGDSSSSDSSGDSCSGDSSSSDSGDDSCSGDSSSHDSDPDSCSGDSSDSKSDSCSGDSDSSSDSSSAGDMCSGNSGTRNSARKSAALRSAKARPRQVRLSLLTLLAAALALPLRRLRASR